MTGIGSFPPRFSLSVTQRPSTELAAADPLWVVGSPDYPGTETVNADLRDAIEQMLRRVVYLESLKPPQGTEV